MSETQPLLFNGQPDFRRPVSKPRRPPVLTRDDYPESDGKPVGETPLHVRVTFALFGALLHWYRGRDDVMVGCDQLMYYEQDNIKAFLVPDIFVVLGVKPRPDAERQTWRIWEEGGYGPDFVLEVTSRSTRRHDEERKHRIYERLGVREYWQFDPTADYLKPELKGHRLGPGGRFEPVVLEPREELLSAPSLLGLELHLRDGNLRFFDPRTGYLRSHEEEAEARETAEEARRIAEARVAELERQLRGD